MGYGIERGGMTGAQIEQHRERVVADVRGGVARGARPVDRRYSQRVIQTRHGGDRKGMRVEDRLSPGHGSARLGIPVRAAETLPWRKDGEGVRVESGSRGIAAERVVDAGVVGRARERLGTPLRPLAS